MTIETSIDALTTQTSGLLEVCVNLKTSVKQSISDAVIHAENAAIVPLISMATNLIDTQTMLVKYITR